MVKSGLESSEPVSRLRESNMKGGEASSIAIGPIRNCSSRIVSSSSLYIGEWWDNGGIMVAI